MKDLFEALEFTAAVSRTAVMNADGHDKLRQAHQIIAEHIKQLEKDAPKETSVLGDK